MPYVEAWQLIWRNLGVASADRSLLDALIDSYSEPHRKYHTLQHLDSCFAHFGAERNAAIHPAEVELALWFHDAVYAIGSPDNERKSADWARAALHAAGVSPAAAQRVHALVMATRHDSAPKSPDEAILLDLDLAILGTRQELFDRFEAQIRAEYESVPQARFQSGRRRILQQFLDRERIYHTNSFSARYETQARANLRRSIALLGD